jgi:hypothetical protein
LIRAKAPFCDVAKEGQAPDQVRGDEQGMAVDWRQRGARFLREPLVHFLAAGALVFALLGGDSAPDERRIIIDAARIERLAGQFAQSFRRPPSPSELDALIRDDLKSEVYYREALRLGLDRDDEVVRRRMRLKMEAFADDPEALAAPDEATLERWLAAHPERFAAESRYSFEQRWLGEGPNSLPPRFERTGAGELRALFGDGFPAALDRVSLGIWHPIVSGVGRHEVRLSERIPATPPRLAEVRRQVEDDWRTATARARAERAYQALLDGYEVTIERPR